jgi:hypothetical protein
MRRAVPARQLRWALKSARASNWIYGYTCVLWSFI